jgi:hypothetical protein
MYDNVYTDFGLKMQLNLANILYLKTMMLREDEVWYQQVGFTLNVRLIELEAMVGTSSTSFLSSYTMSGLYAMIGLRVGF